MAISPQEAMKLEQKEVEMVAALARDIDRVLAERFDGVNPVTVHVTELDVRDIGVVTSRVAQEIVREYGSAGWGQVEFVQDQDERHEDSGGGYTVLRDHFCFAP